VILASVRNSREVGASSRSSLSRRLKRCPWPSVDPLYLDYHDNEWGRPERDGQALFEKLTLDGFQAGLSWITILRKREAFRTAFDGFEPAEIARFDQKRVAALMRNDAIVRNRAKIEGAVLSAQAWLEIEATTGFSDYLWGFVDDDRSSITGRMSDAPTQPLPNASPKI
jgi:DNA-3-methyladenine glycosylase I